MPSYYQQRIAEIEAQMETGRVERVAAHFAQITQKPVKVRPRGHVYFMRAGNSVKIGFSTNVRDRLKSIQTGCPAQAIIVKVVPGDVKTERGFHKRFAEYRKNGEWFDLRGKLAKYLEMCIFAIALPNPTPAPEPDGYL